MDIHDSDQVIHWAGGTPPVHPALLARTQIQAALASHDIATVFRVLNANGWTQRQIGEAARMSQSQVAEIIKGRRVRDYRVLVRIADGLNIPRQLMNLGPAEPTGTYPGGADPFRGLPAVEVDEEMIRRAILAAAGIAATGRPVYGMAELVPLPAPAPVPPPSRLHRVHLVQVRELTRTLRAQARTYGANPHVDSAVAGWASGLGQSPGPEQLRQDVLVAVAELHIHAGWSALDAGLFHRTMYHYGQALEVGKQSGDAYCQAVAMCQAGVAMVEHGHPNDGLTMFQLALHTSADIPADEHRERLVGPGSRIAVQACAQADCATALLGMKDPEGAAREWATARELWQPTAADPSGDLDAVAARLELERGRLDAAASFAAASVRRWETSRRARTHSLILLATIHLHAGEADGTDLAHRAITGASTLSSPRTRHLLNPLATALDTRPQSDHRDLARLARQLATTRP